MILPSPEPPRVEPVNLFFGWLLLALGVLMVLLCGGCTVTLLAVSIMSITQNGAVDTGGAGGVIMTSFIVVGLIGGVPTAAGGLLVWAGWRILRPRRPRQPAAGPTFD